MKLEALCHGTTLAHEKAEDDRKSSMRCSVGSSGGVRGGGTCGVVVRYRADLGSGTLRYYPCLPNSPHSASVSVEIK